MRYLLAILFSLIAMPAFAQTHWGDQPDGGTLYFEFNTIGQTGAPITIGGTADCEVYKDNNTTQLAASITEDYDAITGLHQIVIDTTVSGYDAGSMYTVVASVGTADSISIVGRVIGSFRLSAGIQTGDSYAALTANRAEPAQGAPAASTSILAKMDYLYKAWRNKSTQTATTTSYYDDAGTTVDHKSTVSDNGATFTKGELATGP